MNKLLLLVLLIKCNMVFSVHLSLSDLSLLRFMINFNLSPEDRNGSGVSDFDDDKEYLRKLKEHLDKKDLEVKLRRKT